MEDDFPRVPMTSDRDLLRTLAVQGKRIVAAHLLKSVEAPLSITYQVAGNNQVAKPRFEPGPAQAPGRLYVNAEQYFEGVPVPVAKFSIGGAEVANRWLKDRAGRTLSYDDIRTLRAVLQAIAVTLNAVEEIEAAINAHGGWPVG